MLVALVAGSIPIKCQNYRATYSISVIYPSSQREEFRIQLQTDTFEAKVKSKATQLQPNLSNLFFCESASIPKSKSIPDSISAPKMFRNKDPKPKSLDFVSD